MTYAAIIGAYRGIANVPTIIRALMGQTVMPQHIYVWSNRMSEKLLMAVQNITVVQSMSNLGCFARFTLAFLCRADAVMVFDDDTIPGPKWAANCIQVMERHGRRAILGCRGIILTKAAYAPFKEAGLAARNEHTQECDLVGHSWFFMREHAHFMFDSPPLRWDTGEDMHMCAHAKMAGVRTYCPPHPRSNPDAWGSTRRRLGNAPGRISTGAGLRSHFDTRGLVVKHLIAKGWRPLFME